MFRHYGQADALTPRRCIAAFATLLIAILQLSSFHADYAIIFMNITTSGLFSPPLRISPLFHYFR